ncbi:MAG TPA: hypothetical protein VHP58_04315 [Alphaproteobacteria bacterium]|nr:hypothetical protein [Alphaproteobacteria bacterium]
MKNKRPAANDPLKNRIERQLPPAAPHRSTAKVVGGALLVVALALALGWWLGQRQGARMAHMMERANAIPAQVSATEVSPTDVSGTMPVEGVSDTLVEAVPEAVAPAPKPVQPGLLSPRRPPVAAVGTAGHVLQADQILYCLATGEVLDMLHAHARTTAALAEYDAQTEDYNRRCGVYNYSATSMAQAMKAMEKWRPVIEKKMRQRLGHEAPLKPVVIAPAAPVVERDYGDY